MCTRVWLLSTALFDCCIYVTTLPTHRELLLDVLSLALCDHVPRDIVQKHISHPPLHHRGVHAVPALCALPGAKLSDPPVRALSRNSYAPVGRHVPPSPRAPVAGRGRRLFPLRRPALSPPASPCSGRRVIPAPFVLTGPFLRGPRPSQLALPIAPAAEAVGATTLAPALPPRGSLRAPASAPASSLAPSPFR